MERAYFPQDDDLDLLVKVMGASLDFDPGAKEIAYRAIQLKERHRDHDAGWTAFISPFNKKSY